MKVLAAINSIEKYYAAMPDNSKGLFLHVTSKSDAVGGCSMNFDIALTFDINMTFGNEMRCQMSAGFFCYALILVCFFICL